MSDSIPINLSTEFEQCADAIINGDFETLKSLILKHRDLIHARSTRDHHATLLHYVTANSVEDERQKTPENILEITRFLLEHGIDPNATNDAYGGGTSILDSLISSAHPARAGKKADLVNLLCEFGADPSLNDNSALKTAIAFRYPPAVEILVDWGALINHVVYAAIIGDLVHANYFINIGVQPITTAFGVTYDKPQDILEFACVSASMMGHLNIVADFLEQGIDINAKRSAEDGTALHEASIMGHVDIVQHLLAAGADIASQDKYGFTPLHLAAWHQRYAVMDILLENQAPLEILNTYGGTVLTTTIYAIKNAFYPPDQPAVTLKKLLNAGANADAVTSFPTGHPVIDEVLKPYRT